MHFLHVVGARPNFMKAAPLLAELDKRGVRQTLVHSGQHYDYSMSDVFFEQLGMRVPDANLEVGSGSHAQQTACIMSRFEPVLLEKAPDAVIVYGDVNSTVAVALVCVKLGVRLVHVEAGLRSFDRGMPEEINRLLTDQLADLLFTPSEDGDVNLLREGIPPKRIKRVGNIMIDTLIRLLPHAEQIGPELFARLHCRSNYGLVTLHRPSNVDSPQQLKAVVDALNEIAERLELHFPAHPRTRAMLKKHCIETHPNVHLWAPLPYLECLALQSKATVVITDSGGLQEESTYLGVPCLTLRESTERPVTADIGTNTLIGNDLQLLRHAIVEILAGRQKKGCVPELWDGNTAKRISDDLLRWA